MNDKELAIWLELRRHMLTIGICYFMGGNWRLLTLKLANSNTVGSSLYKTLKKIANAKHIELEYLLDSTLNGYKL